MKAKKKKNHHIKLVCFYETGSRDALYFYDFVFGLCFNLSLDFLAGKTIHVVVHIHVHVSVLKLAVTNPIY